MSPGVIVQNREKGRRRMREGHPTTMCDPKRTHVGEVIDRNTDQRSALQFIGDAHARHKGKPDLELDETLDGFDRGQLKGDIERRMVLGKSLHYFVTRTGLNVVRQEGLVPELFDGDGSQ